MQHHNHWAHSAREDLTSLPELAKTICLPARHRPIRLPTFPSVERTSVIDFSVPATITVPAVGNTTRALLFRQPAYPIWAERSVTSRRARYYLGRRSVEVGDFEVIASEDLMYPMEIISVEQETGQGWVDSTAHSDVSALIGYDAELNQFYAYLPKGSYLSVEYQFSSPISSVAVDFIVWQGPGKETFSGRLDLLASGNNAAGTSGPESNGGWYRISNCSVHSTTTGSYAQMAFWEVYTGGSYASPTGTVTALLPLVAAPESTNSLLPYQSTRVTAAAALFTNVTKVLNKEGTVLAGRLNPADINPFLFGEADLQVLHPSEKYFYALEKGCYTFVPPSTQQDFWDLLKMPVGVPTGSPPVPPAAKTLPVFVLSDPELCNAVLFTDTDATTVSTLAVTADWHMEFRNVSPLFQVAVATTSLESYHLAQIACLQAGFFYENPLHLAELAKRIWEGLNRVFSRVRPVLKAAAPVVASVPHPAARALGAGMAALTLNTPRAAPRKRPKRKVRVVAKRRSARRTARRQR